MYVHMHTYPSVHSFWVYRQGTMLFPFMVASFTANVQNTVRRLTLHRPLALDMPPCSIPPLESPSREGFRQGPSSPDVQPLRFLAPCPCSGPGDGSAPPDLLLWALVPVLACIFLTQNSEHRPHQLFSDDPVCLAPRWAGGAAVRVGFTGLTRQQEEGPEKAARKKPQEKRNQQGTWEGWSGLGRHLPGGDTRKGLNYTRLWGDCPRQTEPLGQRLEHGIRWCQGASRSQRLDSGEGRRGLDPGERVGDGNCQCFQ